MPRTIQVQIVGDEGSLLRAFGASERGAKRFTGTVKEQVAQTIVARVRERESLQKIAAEYGLVARNARKGSEVQVTAARLAQRANRELEASVAHTGRSASSGSRGFRIFSSDLEKAERGALAGSGIFRSFGRSLAFASGGFLAFGGAAAFIRKSVDAAKEAQVTQRQLATQLRNNGRSFTDYRHQIEETNLRLSALAGFTKDELDASLTTILRTVPNVSRALRDNALAADLARARHIGLGQAALVIAKTEAGNTTLLRRQGFQIRKNATAEEALAVVRAKIAGQARAGTTEQERFGAVLHDTEEIIGTGILPTLNKYLVSGTKWLQQMNESGRLQRDVAHAAHEFETGVGAVAGVVKTVDRITGSFAHTLELLLALRVGTAAAGWATSFQKTGLAAEGAEGQVAGLQGRLSGLGALQLAPIVVPIAIEVESSAEAKIKTTFGRFGHIAADVFSAVENTATGGVTGRSIPQQLFEAIFGGDKAKNAAKKAGREIGFQYGEALAEAAAKAAHGRALVPTVDGAGSSGLNVTVAQRNTFFDNAIARILLRGGLGDLQQQLAALNQARGLLEKRLAATKDITRRLSLEDQILQLSAQAGDIRKQITQKQLEQRQQSFSDLIASLQLGLSRAQVTKPFGDDLEALGKIQRALRAEIRALGATADLRSQLFDVQQQIVQARQAEKQQRLDSLIGRQFRELGLTATGDEVTPGVANLKKRLGQISERIAGTSFDTPKLRAQLARFRKVLSEGLVPKDVRAKIRDMLNQIADELKNSHGDQTRFRHVSTDALLSGLGLSPEETRRLRQRLAQVGPGGTVPGRTSQAFSRAGASDSVVVQTDINLDGAKIARTVTKHQVRHPRRDRGRRN